ncbi:MAG: carboxypeptidase regulatory-like domain-containing protein [Gemmatimonadota bacterium]|jgi:hypothetical protein
MKTTLAAVAALLLMPAIGSAQDADMFATRCGVGDVTACNVAGLMYETGAGADRNVDRAIHAYEQACDGGEPTGCTSIGLLYDNGRVIEEDDQEARDWYRRACGLGERMACDLLVALDYEGRILEPRPFFKSGHVGDVSTGNMLPDALVEVQRLGLQVVTDARGRAELGRIPEGTYELRAEVLGYEPVRGVLNVPGYAEFMVLLQPLLSKGSGDPGRISGSVRDSTRLGLADVEVSVVGQPGARTLTNVDGNFLLPSVAPGLVEVQFSLLGFATRRTKLIVQPGAGARVSASMTTDPIDMEPIDVVVEERSAYLERSGFYDRARRGIGQHFTAQDFYGLNPVVLADEFYRVTGVHVSGPDQRGRYFVESTRAGPNGGCRMDSYVDGARTLDGNINIARLSDVEGLEVYHRVEVPAQYNRAGNCGVILIWTKSP